MRTSQLFWLAGLLWVPAVLPAGEIIELKTGHTIEGEVIRERADELIVDIGIEILRVPTEQVARRRMPDEEPISRPAGPEDGFYKTAELPRSSVRDLSAKFGEGVVLVQTPGGLVSGFIINDRGYCVTNHHVIQGETRVSVTIFQQGEDALERQQIKDVKIVALNPFLDLALLQIPETPGVKFTTTFLSDKDDLAVGDPVFAIGNPLGLERSVSEGIISTDNRNFGGVLYLQTTTQINPGNSGGPLFNLRGQVVGVTSMKVAGGEGLGFAIPAFYVRHFLENRDAFAYDRNNPNN